MEAEGICRDEAEKDSELIRSCTEDTTGPLSSHVSLTREYMVMNSTQC